MHLPQFHHIDSFCFSRKQPRPAVQVRTIKKLRAKGNASCLQKQGTRIWGLKLIQRASVDENEIQSGSGPDLACSQDIGESYDEQSDFVLSNA